MTINRLGNIACHIGMWITIVILWFSACAIHHASLILNHAAKEWELPIGTSARLVLMGAKLRLPFATAAMCTLCILFVSIRHRSWLAAMSLASMVAMLIYAAVTLIEVSGPFHCLCDKWMRWY